MADQDAGAHPVFSYGSNSLTQLRGRVGNPDLAGEPARLHGWVRIFCLHSPAWDGSVASLHETAAHEHVTYGTLVTLSNKELERLDAFEGGYARRSVQVEVDGKMREAVVYVSKDPEWRGMPSQQYLTAIRLMLEQMYPAGHKAREAVEIWGQHDRVQAPRLVHVHRHPPAPTLAMPSLFVLANAGRKDPWTMPGALRTVTKSLAKHNIHSTAQLGVALVRGELGKVERHDYDPTELLLPDGKVLPGEAPPAATQVEGDGDGDGDGGDNDDQVDSSPRPAAKLLDGQTIRKLAALLDLELPASP